MPEWYLVILFFGVLSAAGLLWSPLLVVLPAFILSVVALLVEAASSAVRATAHARRTRLVPSAMVALAFVLHALQPLARLTGRVKSGLSPWRSRGPRAIAPWSASGDVWSENWRSPETWVAQVQRQLASLDASVFSGGPWDDWDLEVRGGLFAGVRVQVATEEHGRGRQLVRWRYRRGSWAPLSR